MSRYDDDHVIALLRDAVPPTPDVPDRISAVKQRAGHQRAMVWTQTIGALTAVLLVVGVAAAVATPGGGQRVQPTARPIEAVAAALAKATSVRFDARMKALGTPDVPESRMTGEEIRQMMDSHVVGAVTRDGDLEADGDLSFLTAVFGVVEAGSPEPAEGLLDDFHVRVVDGVEYRTAQGDESLPPGKKWIRGDGSGDDESPAAQLDRALKLLNAVAENVRHVGGDTVRGTPVAEYELTVPARYTKSKDLRVRFALDDEDRLRRVSAEFSLTEMLIGPLYGVENGDDAGMSSGWTEYPEGTPGPGVQPLQPLQPMQPPPPRPTAPSGQGLDPLMVRVEVELFGYGDRIDVVAPPASEVITEEVLWGSHQDNELLNCMQAAGDDEDEIQACQEAAGFALPPDYGGCTISPNGASTCDASAAPAPYGSPPQTSKLSPRPARPSPAATASPSP